VQKAVKVLFVASNPSTKSPDNTALHPATRSRKILDRWISDMNIAPIFINVCDEKTYKNKPLSKQNILDNLNSLQLKITNTKINTVVALGDTASLALSLIKQPHVKVPHPSGLNRKLNDDKEIQKIKNTIHNISKGIIK